MSQALYRKWRPARFSDVVGQEHVTRTLQNAVASERVGHAYLFCGPRGTGKTTSARLLAKAVNCLHDTLTERPDDECHICKAINENRFLDLIEIDAASNTGVDDIRDLRDKINFSPSEGRFKVYIIDEVHMLSTAAFNALLKTLEEPPSHAMFILATTEEHKVPLTIKSRCQQFNFRLFTQAEIEQRLTWMAEQESLNIEPEALSLVAQHGAGSLRDAESLLDQLVVAPDQTITLEQTQKILGTASSGTVVGLTNAIIEQDGTTGLAILHEALSTGADARQVARQLVSYLRQVLLLQTAGTALSLNLPKKEQKDMLAQAGRINRPLLLNAIKKFNEAAMTNSSSWQPQLPLELAFVELLSTPQTAQTTVVATPVSKPTPVAKPAPVVTEPVAEPKPKKETKPKKKKTAAKTEAKKKQETKEADVPQPPTPSPQPLAEGSLSLESVTSNWPKFMVMVRDKDKNLQSLLAMTKPLAIENGTLVLGFEYPILRDKFRDNVQGIGEVSDILSALCGVKCQVRAVLTKEYSVVAEPNSAKPAPSPAKTAPPIAEPVTEEPAFVPPMPEPPDNFDEDFRSELEGLADEFGGIVGDIK